MTAREALAILECSTAASMQEVKDAYRQLVQVWHPDRFAHNERLRRRAEAKMKIINAAYATLEELHRTGYWTPGTAPPDSGSSGWHYEAPESDGGVDDSGHSRQTHAEEVDPDAPGPAAESQNGVSPRLNKWRTPVGTGLALLVLVTAVWLVWALAVDKHDGVSALAHREKRSASNRMLLREADGLIREYASERSEGGDGAQDDRREAAVTAALLAAARAAKSKCSHVDRRITIWLGDMAYDGCTRLHAAAMNGDARMTELLLLRGADAKVRSRSGKTPMDFAAFHGHSNVIKVLCRFGCEVDAFQLSQAGAVKTVATLVQADSSLIVTKDPAGYTLLHCAAECGRYDVVEYLIRQGADVNCSVGGRTPLHSSAIAGHVEVARLLISAGAVVDARDDDGYTPLLCAGIYGNPDVMRVLLARGADVNARTKEGTSMLGFLQENGDPEGAECALLRRAGAKP